MKRFFISLYVCAVTVAIALYVPLAMGMGVPVYAAPPADPESGHSAQQVLDNYRHVSREAEKINGQYLAATDKLDSLKKEVTGAHQKLAATKVDEAKTQAAVQSLQKQIDVFMRSLYEGAHMSDFFAILLSDTPDQTMDQLTDINILSRKFDLSKANYLHTIAHLKIVRQQLHDEIILCGKKETETKDQLKKAEGLGVVLQIKIRRIRAIYQSMTGKQLQELIGPSYSFDPSLLPKGTSPAVMAVDAAISQVGKPYVWGGTGPYGYDCSGLMMWAYRQAGLNIPRTSEAQLNGGKSISRDQLQPGDLIIIYSDASHVAMYIGNGMVVHASTFGVPVQIVPIDAAGPYLAARRY